MKKYSLLFVLLFYITNSFSQYKLEHLDRGLVAVNTNNGVFVSWRIPGEEWYGVTYNLYKNGTKINSEPLEVSNYLDNTGSLGANYTVTAIVDGVEQSQSEAIQPLAQQYLEIPLVARPAGYVPNDATTADLDGDGEYEIILKRVFHDWSEQATNFTYFEAYKMDGTFMWEINVGPNIMSSSAVEINIAAYDLDEDGKAEVFLRTSEGTIFGDGSQINDTDGDGITNYRYSVLQSPNQEYMNEGPEFLSLVNGETGVELDRVDFIPRGNSSDWGDGYGHRANKFFFGAPYLDGIKPSIFIGRGIYTKTVMRAYDVVNKKLSMRWEFNTNNNPSYASQGNHNYSIADVDNDGRDEIVYGSMTVDNDGTGLYSTELGHGDALHVGDLDPFRKGIEVWKCLENSPNYGTVLYDGATGQILIHDILGRDCGRSCAANISDDVKGATLWGSTTAYSASTREAVSPRISSTNFRIYWNGDLLEELLDNTSITSSNSVNPIFTANGCYSNNGTKATPTLQADLFGDWREEVILPTNDNQHIRIYTTVDTTPHRIYTLMHDNQYRQAICWQMCGYNQPPHKSFFLGSSEGITIPPPPKTNKGRLMHNGSSTWDTASSVWNKDGSSVVYTDGSHVAFDGQEATNTTITLSETVMPKVLTVSSAGNYTLDASGGSLSGTMQLTKQGKGQFNLNGSHDYSGPTEIWDGYLNFSGTLSESPVWVNLFGELAAEGDLGKGVNMKYGSKLFVGGKDIAGNLNIIDSLTVDEKTELIFDIYGLSNTQNDSLIVNGNVNLTNGAIVKIIPHLSEGSNLSAGEYVLISSTGSFNLNINEIELEGLSGNAAKLEIKNNSLILNINAMRAPSTVYWDGSVSNNWDLNSTENFLNQSANDVFATNDHVIIDDNATSTTINITENLLPNSITFNNSVDYVINGSGDISGPATITKQGTGKVTIANTNSFTGKVLIESGTIEVNSMPNSIDGNSALGSVSTNPELLELNGGTLKVTSATRSDRALKIGTNGGTVNNTHSLDWASIITGENLTKEGNGELILHNSNTINSLKIRNGAVRLFEENASLGGQVIFEGGKLYCYDNAYSYSLADYPWIIEAGQRGTVYTDSRCEYRNTLTGSGTLSLNIPWVRSDFTGDWSAFEGTITLMGTSWFRNFNNYGYGKAKLSISSGASLTAMNRQTVQIGALVGNGSLDNASNWIIGEKDQDFTFGGNIIDGNITKEGSGTMTISGTVNTNGTVYINEGGLIVNDKLGANTGTNQVYIKANCFLAGNGTINKPISVRDSGTLYAGLESISSYLNVQSVNMLNQGIYSVTVHPQTNLSNKIISTGIFQAAGELHVEKSTNQEYLAGMEYKIVMASSITGGFSSIVPETPGEGLAWDLSDFNSLGVLKVTTSLSTTDQIIEDQVSFYPNPTTGILHVNCPPDLGKVTVQIETINGITLNKYIVEDTSNMTLDLSSFERGMYLVRVMVSNKIIIGKIILK